MITRPPQRRAQIVVLPSNALKPVCLTPAHKQCHLCLLGQRQKITGMPRARSILFAVFRELLQREVADDLQHHEPRLSTRTIVPPKQVLVDERCQPIQHRPTQVRILATQRLRGAERAAAGKDTQAAEEALLAGHEQVVTPSNGVPQRPLASRQVPRAADQEGQAVFQPLQQQRRREDVGAGSGQLNC
jgi:hypothetical protein